MSYIVVVGKTAYDLDIETDQGTDQNIPLTFFDSTGAAYSFTGKTLKAQVRTRAGGTLIKTLQSPSSGITISSNVATLDGNFDGVAARLAAYDIIETTTSSGKKKKLSKGAFRIAGTMTQ